LIARAQDKKVSSKNIRDIVLKILRQKDFSPASYILILGQLIDYFGTSSSTLKEDLEFWRHIISFVPYVALENVSQLMKLKSCIDYLVDNIPELDFSGVKGYLEERYEKPYLALGERNTT
jgi:hypothetical protein